MTATDNTMSQATPPARDDTHHARVALDTIRKLYDAAIAPPRPAGAPARVPPRSKPPAPQAVVRADVVIVLAFWARELTIAYPDTLTTPTVGPEGELREVARYVDLTSPHSAARYLADHLHVIREWGYLPRFTREVRELAARLTTLTTPAGSDRPLLGPCHLTVNGETPDRTNGHVPRCTGDVRAIPKRNPADGTVTYQDARCNRCRTVAVIEWWRTQWGTGTGLVTAEELARTLTRLGIAKVKPGASTIRVWAHRGVIHPSGTSPTGERLYDVAAVVMALNAREASRASATVSGEGATMPTGGV